MLIDLARNDVGRIAQIGSVTVTDKMVIEKYSHVQHIVSSVEGKLKPRTTNFDVLRATFPAGTLSGVPKVRAMELIDELEPVKRGLYGGADSVPESEWQETENKARAVLRAAEQVQDGLDSDF
jgi:anthranilate synthase component 1